MLCIYTGEHGAEHAQGASLGSAPASSSLTAFFKQLKAKPHRARNGGAEGAAASGSGQAMEQAPSLASSLGNEGTPQNPVSTHLPPFEHAAGGCSICAVHPVPVAAFVQRW